MHRSDVVNRDDGAGSQQREHQNAPLEEEPQQPATCRICLAVEDDLSTLAYPCACKGSSKHVHEVCLTRWLETKHAGGKTRCEVCGERYLFASVYDVNAPSSLPLGEILLGVVGIFGRGSLFALRIFLVFVVWFGTVPLMTTWLWRLAFCRSLQQACRRLLARLDPVLVVMDCVVGSFLSVAIVFIFLGISSLRTYILQLGAAGQDVAAAVDGEAEAGNDAIGAGAGDVRGEQREAGAGVAAGLEDAAFVPAPGPVVDDEDERLADEEFAAFDDLPIEELVGLRGPMIRLFEHAATLTTSNAIFIFVAAFFPYSLGHAVLQMLSSGRALAQHAPPLPLPGAGGVIGAGMAMGMRVSLGRLAQHAVNTAARATGIIPAVATVLLESTAETSESVSRLLMAMAKLEAELAPPPLSDLAILALGYLVLATVGAFWLITLSLCSVLQKNTRVGGSVHHILAGTVIRHAIQCLRQTLIILKVVLLLVIDLGVFPAMCGWWLDLNTLDLMGSTMPGRLAFHATAPMLCVAIHWAAGLIYMLHVSVFMVMVREILCPGVLAFIRDPADPNYNPFQELVEQPATSHLRRVFLSTIIYGNLAVLLVYAPVKLARVLLPEGFFPLRFTTAMDGTVGTGTELPIVGVPVDMLMLHVFAPFILQRVNPRRAAKRVMHRWLRWASKTLRLSHYLMPEEAAAAPAAPAAEGGGVLGVGGLQPDVGAAAGEAAGPMGEGGTAAAAAGAVVVNSAAGALTVTLYIAELHGPEENVDADDDIFVRVGVSADLDLPWTDTVSSLTAWAAQLVGVPPSRMTVKLGEAYFGPRRSALLRDDEPLHACVAPHPHPRTQQSRSLPALEVRFQPFGSRRGGLLHVYHRRLAPAVSETAEAELDVVNSRGGRFSFAGALAAAPLRVRVAVLTSTTWVGICLMTAAFFVGPIVVGRGLFEWIGLTAHVHDMYALTVGAYVIAGVGIGGGAVARLVQNSPPAQLARAAVSSAATCAKAAALLVAWLGVVPLLLGVLFELVVLLPLSEQLGSDPDAVSDAQQSPLVGDDSFHVHRLYQDWAMGLMLLKLWHRLVMAGLAVPPTPPEWVIAVKRFHDAGLAAVDARWVFQAVLGPLVGGLALAIVLPFAVTPPSMRLFAHLLGAVLLLAAEVAGRTKGWVRRLHDDIRDDHYLIGRRLQNFPEKKRKNGTMNE